jgi:hypothetical protein
MESMRESWTDKRLDDLNDKVDRIDADLRAHRVETRTEFTALRGEIQHRLDRVDVRFDQIDERFVRLDERLDDRFDALHRMLFQFAGLVVAALIGLFAAQL